MVAKQKSTLGFEGTSPRMFGSITAQAAPDTQTIHNWRENSVMLWELNA